MQKNKCYEEAGIVDEAKTLGREFLIGWYESDTQG